MMEQRQGLVWSSELSEEFEVKVRMHHGFVLSPVFLLWWYMLSLNFPESVR